MLVLAIHDASFPSDRDEDVGRGAPSTRAAERLFGFAQRLGFGALQLGPQGQTSRDNPSPYDAMLFSRHLGTLGLRAFADDGAYAGLVSPRVRAAAIAPGGPHCDHARAHDTSHALVAAVAAARDPAIAARLAEFRAAHGAAWLDRDAAAVAGDDPAARAHHALGQLLAAEEHARVRERCARHGLAVYGDLQVGLSPHDAAIWRDAFLPGVAMGAPPSRTNPEGQAWGYGVLDPDQLADGGPARTLLATRIARAFADYDSLRVDHPHGLVCPWVYPAGTTAVRDGARLFESPDLPALARHAIARLDQLDLAQPRHADGWVRALEPAQVARYAMAIDAIVAAAAGRPPISCEVLSTLPRPLAEVLARHGLGRWRVLPKANLDDPDDGYRSEHARPEDWVMLGNHDTAPIFAVVRAWSPAVRERWARHLVARLRLDAATTAELATNPGLLPTALLAELLASRAGHVSIFFADLFGYDERYNTPGTVSPANWSLRLPPDFEQLYAARLARGAALDLARARELATRRAG